LGFSLSLDACSLQGLPSKMVWKKNHYSWLNRMVFLPHFSVSPSSLRHLQSTTRTLTFTLLLSSSSSLFTYVPLHPYTSSNYCGVQVERWRFALFEEDRVSGGFNLLFHESVSLHERNPEGCERHRWKTLRMGRHQTALLPWKLKRTPNSNNAMRKGKGGEEQI
jgi:hypothetical protein